METSKAALLIQTLTAEKQDRLQAFNATYIQIPRYEEIVDKIHRCRIRAKYSAEPPCILVLGETGVGKTSLIKRYLRKYAVGIGEKGDVEKCPVLYASIPRPATIGGLATELLQELGDPFAENGTIPRLTSRLSDKERGLLKRCGVELTLLDEFQHLVEGGSPYKNRVIADWVKTIINNSGIPFGLFGLPESRTVLNYNSQLKRRFRAMLTMAPFRLDKPEDPESEFRLFLTAVEKQLYLPERSGLGDPTTAFRFFCASRGYISPVMKVVRTAFEYALLTNEPKLTLELLAEAFEEDFDLSGTKVPNPFTVSRKEIRMVPPEVLVDEEDPTTNNRKGRTKEEKASSALRKG